MKLSSLNKFTSVITLDAFLNAESEDALFANLTETLQGGKDKVILDFRPVDHMNSAGASALVKLTAMTKKNGVKLFAYKLNKRYREILESAKNRGLMVMLTLFHWQIPLWLHDPIAVHNDIESTDKRGWLDNRTLIARARNELIEYTLRLIREGNVL